MAMTTDREIRDRCIKRAIRALSGNSTGAVVPLAQQFYDFIMGAGVSKAVEDPSFSKSPTKTA